MASVQYIGIGTFQSGTGALTAPMPAGIERGDLLLLLIHSVNETISTPTTTTGTWTEIGNQSSQGTGTGAAIGSVRLAVFYKFARTSEASASVADSGNLTCAQTIAYRNVDRATPFGSLTSGVVTGVPTKAFDIAGVTTVVPNTLIAITMALGRDANNTNNLGSLVNSNLANIVEIIDQTVNTATGGGLAAFNSSSAAAQSIGTSTVNIAGNWDDAVGYLLLSIRPKKQVFSFN